MFIIKNAFLNITSSKGRNVLIGIIVFIIAVSSCIALSVKESAKKAEEEGLANITVTGTISIDRQAMMEKARSEGGDIRSMLSGQHNLSLDDLKKYAGSSYVKDFIYTISSSVNGSVIEPVETDTTVNDTQNDTRSDNFPGGMNGGRGMSFGTQGQFLITGYSSYDAMNNFLTGVCKITDGEIFDVDSDKYECIISDELSLFNNIKIGDTITLTNPNNEEQTFNFIVKGIYNNTNSGSANNFRQFSTAGDPANQIYTSYGALEKAISYTSDNATIETDDYGRERSTAMSGNTSGTYIFADADSFNAFKADVRQMGLSEDYTVSSTDINSYENSLVPVINTANYANTLLLIVLIIGAIILVVLNIFNIRERKYEVGVLTAIGMKKGKVALQFVSELLIVTFVAIILGAAVGAVASVPTSNALLESQISAQEALQQEQSNNFGRQGGNFRGGSFGDGSMSNRNTQINYISTLNASTDMQVVFQLMFIGIALTILASLSAVIFIMRYEPLKILSERA